MPWLCSNITTEQRKAKHGQSVKYHLFWGQRAAPFSTISAKTKLHGPRVAKTQHLALKCIRAVQKVPRAKGSKCESQRFTFSVPEGFLWLRVSRDVKEEPQTPFWRVRPIRPDALLKSAPASSWGTGGPQKGRWHRSNCSPYLPTCPGLDYCPTCLFTTSFSTA